MLLQISLFLTQNTGTPTIPDRDAWSHAILRHSNGATVGAAVHVLSRDLNACVAQAHRCGIRPDPMHRCRSSMPCSHGVEPTETDMLHAAEPVVPIMLHGKGVVTHAFFIHQRGMSMRVWVLLSSAHAVKVSALSSASPVAQQTVNLDRHPCHLRACSCDS